MFSDTTWIIMYGVSAVELVVLYAAALFVTAKQHVYKFDVDLLLPRYGMLLITGVALVPMFNIVFMTIVTAVYVCHVISGISSNGGGGWLTEPVGTKKKREDR